MSRPSFFNLVGAMAVLAFAGGGCTRENSNVAPVGGGTGTPTGPDSRTPCASNADCGGGQICTTIGCCPGCHSDADCAADSTCVAGAPNFCAPKSTNPKPAPGNSGTIVNPETPKGPIVTKPVNTCGQDADCLKGMVCNVGTCQASCTANSCGAGQACTNGRCYAAGGGACGIAAVVQCTTTAQCGTGRVCTGGACHAQCENNSKCGLGEACNSGVCLAAAASQCTFDADCGLAFRCINATCHPLCATDEQCGAANICDSGVCRANNRVGG